jgi:hypothetical protein
MGSKLRGVILGIVSLAVSVVHLLLLSPQAVLLDYEEWVR